MGRTAIVIEYSHYIILNVTAKNYTKN